MKAGSWTVALLMSAAGTQCVHAAETQIAYHKSNGTQVFAERQGDRLLLRSLGPATVPVAYEIDADANGAVDPDVDVSYSIQKDGTLCAAKWVNDTTASRCGTLKTTAHASQEAIGDLVLRRINVPLSEVARNGRTVRFRLAMHDAAKGHSRAWLAYDLATGEATSSPPPSASTTTLPAGATPVATASRPSPATPPATGLDDQALTERYDAGEVYMGRECRFKRLPEVRMLAHRFDGTYGEFMVRPQESDSAHNNEFRFSIYPDGRETFRLVVSHKMHKPAQVTSAVLVVDGARFTLDAKHPIDQISPVVTYMPYVAFERLGGDAKAALMRADTARLDVMTENGRVTQWTYPVGNFRHLRQAMKLSGWKCASGS